MNDELLFVDGSHFIVSFDKSNAAYIQIYPFCFDICTFEIMHVQCCNTQLYQYIIIYLFKDTKKI